MNSGEGWAGNVILNRFKMTFPVNLTSTVRAITIGWPNKTKSSLPCYPRYLD